MNSELENVVKSELLFEESMTFRIQNGCGLYLRHYLLFVPSPLFVKSDRFIFSESFR